MAKGIIVVDIPDTDCRGCQCFRKQFPFCGAVGRYIEPIVGKKPEWCPIKPMPNRWEVCGKYPQPGMPVPSYQIGWNACLDKIEGE